MIGLAMLAVVGLAPGWIASLIAGGRHRWKYMATGLVGALAAPLLLAILGVTALAAWGIAAMVVAALIGAVIVLLIARLAFD